MTPANQHTGIERLSDDDLDTIEAIARNGQVGRITAYEIGQLVAGYRDWLSLRASAEQQEPDIAAARHKCALTGPCSDIGDGCACSDDELLAPHPHSSSAVDGRVTEALAAGERFNEQAGDPADTLPHGRAVIATIRSALAGGSNGRE